MQETQVQYLVQEDPARLTVTKAVYQNCWAVYQNHNYWRLWALKPMLCNEKPPHHSEEQLRLSATRGKPTPQQRPSTVKTELKKKSF